MLAFMLAPFVACMVLVGIHSYLGLHVIAREVIFVDLSLAQMAALGSVIALLAGVAPDSATAFVSSLLFTGVGAAVLLAACGLQLAQLHRPDVDLRRAGIILAGMAPWSAAFGNWPVDLCSTMKRPRFVRTSVSMVA